MKNHKLQIILFSFLLISFKLLADKNDLIFEKISETNGLSHRWVRTIVKDSEGFIWFGTMEGLNRFDGTSIKVFSEDYADTTNVISDYNFYSLYDANDSILWLGTSNGLSKYNKKTGIFSNYLTSEFWDLSNSKTIRTIAVDAEGIIWLGIAGTGVCRFDERTNSYKLYSHDEKDPTSLSSNNVYSIVTDGEKIWVGTSGGGLDLFDKRNGTFIHFNQSEKKGSLSNNSVYNIFKDSKEKIWVGTDKGVNRYNPSSKSFTTYFHHDNDSNSLCDDRVVSIAEDKFGRMWFATRNGLSCLKINDDGQETFTNYYHDDTNTKSLITNELTSIYIDNNSILWIGTSNGGVNQTFLESKRFSHFKHEQTKPQSISKDIIRSIFEDKDKNIWVGTDGGGLNLMLNGTKTFEHIKHSDDKTAFHNNVVLSIMQDKSGDLWFGTYGSGINKLSYQQIKNRTKSFTHYTNEPTNPNSIPCDIVKDIFEDTEGRIWVGTDEGLCLFNRKSNNFTRFGNLPNSSCNLSDNRIQSKTIFQDSKGTIWIGTWNGLNKMLENRTDIPQIMSGVEVPPHSICFKRYQRTAKKSKTQLSDNRVISIFEDSNHTLWVGTFGKGLNRFDEKKETFKRFEKKEGLIDNHVYSILEDNSKNLWVSTNKGLSRLSLKTETLKNFDEYDGIQNNNFYWGAACKLKNGELAFGGINGFSVFNPEKIQDNHYIPPIMITDIQINNKSVKVQGKEHVPIWHLNELILPYGKNLMNIEYVALNFIQSEKNNYAYKLEGFNDDWVRNGNKKSATYTNLSPGDYNFRVIASNNDGVWNEVGTSLKITITPPIYATWWFRILAIGILIAAIWVYVYIKIRNIRKQRNELTKMIEERTHELHEANSVLYNLNREMNEVNTLLEETNEEITEQNELVIFQRDEIAKKNEELELHRNHLEELVQERTEELVTAKDKAQESERLKAAFLANMSHEIRTPLNAIVGFSNLLTHDTNTPEEIDDFSKQVAQNTESLLILIDDILDLSLIESKQSKRNDEPFNANDFINNFFKYWHTHYNLDTRPITLSNNILDKNIFFNTDQHKMRQILGNLMSNACKFTEAGGIELGFEHRDGSYLFWVKDTGIGIAEKHLGIIFDWFRKIEEDKNRLYRGTGLGLAISARLADLLEGKLWVESELGKGSTFYFSLPETVVNK